MCNSCKRPVYVAHIKRKALFGLDKKVIQKLFRSNETSYDRLFLVGNSLAEEWGGECIRVTHWLPKNEEDKNPVDVYEHLPLKPELKGV